MAKKKLNSSRRSSPVNTMEEFVPDERLIDRFRGVLTNPAVRHIAADMATNALTKFFRAFSNRYPELTQMVTGGLDSIEEKLVNYKNENKEDTNLQH